MASPWLYRRYWCVNVGGYAFLRSNVFIRLTSASSVSTYNKWLSSFKNDCTVELFLSRNKGNLIPYYLTHSKHLPFVLPEVWIGSFSTLSGIELIQAPVNVKIIFILGVWKLRGSLFLLQYLWGLCGTVSHRFEWQIEDKRLIDESRSWKKPATKAISWKMESIFLQELRVFQHETPSCICNPEMTEKDKLR